MRAKALARNLGALAPHDRLPKAWEARRQLILDQRRESRLTHSENLRRRYAAGWQPYRHRKVDDATLRALGGQGLTGREIAARTGVDPATVRLRQSALGLKAVVPVLHKATDAELLALREAGLWGSEIAARVGMTTLRVNARLRQLRRRGVPVPAPIRPRPIPWRRVSDEQLVGLAQRGLRAGEIAAEVGIARRAVAYRLERLRLRGLLAAPAPRTRLAQEQVLGLVREGLRPGEIATRAGVSRDTENKWMARLRQRGLLTSTLRTDWRDRDRALIELSRAGLGPGQIAARLGLRASQVSRRLYRLRRRGVAVPPPARRRGGPQPRVSNDELLALVREGLHIPEIAARVGMTWGAVWQRLRSLRARGLLPVPLRRAPTGKPRRVSDKDVLALSRAGLRRSQIAGRIGLSLVTVARRLRALRERGQLPACSAGLIERDRQLLELRGAGLWPSEIAARTGLPRHAVLKRLWTLRRRGVAVPTPPGRRPSARRKITDEELVVLTREGLGGPELAARAGLTLRYVRTRLSSLRRRGLLSPAAPSGRQAAPEEPA